MSNFLAALEDLAKHADFSEEDLKAYHHAYETLKNARHANFASGDGRKKLRALTRFLKKEWSAAQVAKALSWEDEAWVAQESEDWLCGNHQSAPLATCWLRPASHPWVAQARQLAEEESDRRDALRSRLVLRLKVVGGALGEKEAAELAGLSLAEWQLFCANEDAADPAKDREYREGWIFQAEPG